jgi:UDP-N-acetylglucosamine 4,6-dehydratase
MQGGEIFIPKIPSMKVTALAEAIAPKAKREIIGIRPGEKLHEVLISEEEAYHAREFDNHFVIEPEHSFWSKDNLKGGKTLPVGFKFSSDNNTRWLTTEELKKMAEVL